MGEQGRARVEQRLRMLENRSNSAFVKSAGSEKKKPAQKYEAKPDAVLAAVAAAASNVAVAVKVRNKNNEKKKRKNEFAIGWFEKTKRAKIDFTFVLSILIRFSFQSASERGR